VTKVSGAETCHSVDKGDASYANERTVMVTVLNATVSTLGTITKYIQWWWLLKQGTNITVHYLDVMQILFHSLSFNYVCEF